jgi:hypothetical protein
MFWRKRTNSIVNQEGAMSRSRKHNPFGGRSTAETDKRDKRFASRRLRRINRMLLGKGTEVFKALKEVSCACHFNKRGKTRFDAEKKPALLRK